MSFLQNQQPRVAMVAGETSGDLLAGLLLDGMRQQWPQVQSYGIGGSQMQQRGFDALWPSERLAVHGYSFEVLMRLWDILSDSQTAARQAFARATRCLCGNRCP